MIGMFPLTMNGTLRNLYNSVWPVMPILERNEACTGTTLRAWHALGAGVIEQLLDMDGGQSYVKGMQSIGKETALT